MVLRVNICPRSPDACGEATSPLPCDMYQVALMRVLFMNDHGTVETRGDVVTVEPCVDRYYTLAYVTVYPGVCLCKSLFMCIVLCIFFNTIIATILVHFLNE